MNAARKYVVGLTGGIGSGKSAAAKCFRELGVEVIDVDVLAREVVAPGQPALEEIASHFGSELLTTDGRLDRVALRDIIFSNPQQKSWLEGLLHPLIAKLLLLRLDEVQSPYAILESPLLFETEQHMLTDRLLVIDVCEDTQLARAIRRDGSEKETIRSIMASQIARAERRNRADDIVSNEGNLEQLKEHIEVLHTSYMEFAKTK